MIGRRLAMLVALAGLTAQAAEIREHSTRLDVSDDGTGVAATVLELVDLQPGSLRVPLGSAVVSDLRPGEVPTGIALLPGSADGRSWVDIQLPPGVPAAMRLAFSYRLAAVLVVPKPETGQKSAFPEGSRLLRHAFVNTQDAVITRYRMTVLLPSDSIVHGVREELPKRKRTEMLPRVMLDRFDGRQGAALQTGALAQGDRASMELEVVNAHRSAGWLLALVPLALAYMWVFRDLVRRPTGDQAPPSRPVGGQP